jgi:hypothetical protein
LAVSMGLNQLIINTGSFLGNNNNIPPYVTHTNY